MNCNLIKCERAKKTLTCLGSAYCKSIRALEKYFSPLLLLVMRLWIANIFFKSGSIKFSNLETTKLLFEYEYVIPHISPSFAAYSSTFFELTCSILLALGLATRLAALPLIGMILIIQICVLQSLEHFYWLLLMVSIFIFGGKCLSLDALIGHFWRKNCQKTEIKK